MEHQHSTPFDKNEVFSRWSFTCFDVSETAVEALKKHGKKLFMMWGMQREEAPTTHHPHLQGWFQLTAPHKLTFLKSYYPLSQAHLEPAKGSTESNRQYCSKIGGTQRFEKVVPFAPEVNDMTIDQLF
jgi:hypothetical protein